MKLEEIKNLIEKEFSLELSTRKRTLEFVEARCIFYKICKDIYPQDFNFSKIGKFIHRNHATVIHGLKTFESLYMNSNDFRGLYHELKDETEQFLDLNDININVIDGFISRKDKLINKLLEKNKMYLNIIGLLRTKEITEETTKSQNTLLNDLKKLSDSDILEFRETRLKPYLNMLKTRVKQKQAIQVVGARLIR